MNDPGYIIGSDPAIRTQPNIEKEIERAKRLGTYDKVIRTPQYQGGDQAHPAKLLIAVNALGDQTRQLQADKDRQQRQILNLRFRYALAIAVTVEVVHFILSRFFK